MMNMSDLAYMLNLSTEELEQKLKIVRKEPKDLKKLSPQDLRYYLANLGLGFGPRVLTLAALKGGIGKTFLSTNVAARAAMLGAKVLLIDLDAEACATNTLLSEEQINSPEKLTIYEIFKENKKLEAAIMPTKYPGLDIVPASLRVSKAEKIIYGQNPKMILRRLIEGLNYDYIFFELPPSFSTLSGAAYLSSNLILIPCTPNIYALESVDLTIEAINELSAEFECKDIQYKIVMNMFNPHRNASQDTLGILKEDHPNLLLPFCIKESADVQNAINAGMTIYEYKCSKSIKEGVDELVKHLCPIVSLAEVKQYQKIYKVRSLSYTEQAPLPRSSGLTSSSAHQSGSGVKGERTWS